MPSSGFQTCALRSEEHTSELQSHDNLVCRLLLEKKHEDATEHIVAVSDDVESETLPALARALGAQTQPLSAHAPAQPFALFFDHQPFFFMVARPPDIYPFPPRGAFPV